MCDIRIKSPEDRNPNRKTKRSFEKPDTKKGGKVTCGR